MSDFDQGARYAARRIDEPAPLRWLVEEPIWLAWRWRGWLDTQSIPFPGERDRRFDTVAWFDRPNGDAPPLAVVLEFMSRPRTEVLERLTEYTLRVRRELPLQRDPLVKFDVIGILVNLTGEMPSAAWGMTPLDTAGLGLQGRLGLRNLATRSAQDLLAGVRAGKVPQSVLAWLPLLAGADDPEVVKEWGRLAGAETDERLRADLGGIARVFAALADRGEVWNPLLEGWNMERSLFLEEIERRGQLRATRTHMILVLRTRLKKEVPADLVEAIHRQTDPTTLDRWFNEALLVDTADDARVRFGLSPK
jgi:hypothetical protein